MTNEITLTKPATGTLAERTASENILSDFAAFENAQRIAKMLTQSAIIPRDYQNNLPNVMVAMDIAIRNRLSPIIVMQNLNVISGRPAWSGKFILTALSATKVTDLDYETVTDGEIKLANGGSMPNLKCRVTARDRKTGTQKIGPWVSLKMAVDEGWYNRGGSKWRTMPEMMIRYRAATFFASVYYPDLSVGIAVDDEAANENGFSPAADAPISAAHAEPATEVPPVVTPPAEEPVKKKAKKAKDAAPAKADAAETTPPAADATAAAETTPPPVVSPAPVVDAEWEAFND